MAGLFPTIRFQFQPLKPAHNGPIRRMHARGQPDHSTGIDKGQATARRMDSTNRLRTRVPAKASRKTSNGPPYPDTPADGRLHYYPSHTLATRNTKPPRNNNCAWRSDTSRCSLLPTLHGHSSHLRNDSVYPVGITFQQADETQSRCHSCKSDGQSSLPLGPREDWASVSEHNDPRTAIPDLSSRATQRREENRRHSSSDIILAKTKLYGGPVRASGPLGSRQRLTHGLRH